MSNQHSQHPQPIQKYRPVLSAAQISHIIALCKRDGTRQSFDVLAQLAMYEYKIQNAVLSPAYTETPKEPLINSLGFEETRAAPEQESHEVSTETLYNLWMKEPEALSVSQLERVREWRYQNNKMTMDEEKLFEREVLGLSV